MSPAGEIPDRTGATETGTGATQAGPADGAENPGAAARAADPLPGEDRHGPAAAVVRRYTLGSMAIGLIPVPLADLAALFALQLKMLHSLARLYGIAFRADLGRAAIASLAGGALPVAASPSLAASLGKLVPGIGQTLSTGSLMLLNAAATYALGKVFTQHFASGGTFLSFDPEAVRDYFQEQFKEGRAAAQAMRDRGRQPE